MKPTLLIIDNEETILQTLKQVFANCGYTILTADGGQAGLDLLASHPVQVIISAEVLPTMTGSEFFTRVKKKYPNTIRMILSAHADFNAVKDAINEGDIYKFLAIPWDDHLLRQQVAQAFVMSAEKVDKERQLMRLLNYTKSKGFDINDDSETIISETELQQALTEKQFVIYYQPIVTTKTDEIKTVEALLRWHHPTRGLLTPNYFIPLCEENGLIIPIGAWTLYSACHQLKCWQNQGFDDLTISVNLSPVQSNDPDLLHLIQDVLDTTQIPSTNLELEITESLLTNNVDLILSILRNLRNLGIQLSLDNFGTGYSSLDHLKFLPLNKLKIDKSFIADLVTKPDQLKIVSAIVTLARNIGIKVVAEGVETLAQLEMLRKSGCDLVQGYLISKPVPEKELTLLLNAKLK